MAPVPKITYYPPTIQKHVKKASLVFAKKMAFKTLKDKIQGKKNKSLGESSNSSSKVSEDSYNPPHLQSAIYNDSEEMPPEFESPEVIKEKSCLYLSSFWRISFDWDERYVSDSLKLLKSDSQNEN